MNTWHGIGRLCADPALRFSQSGKAICRFDIAVNRGRDQEPDYVPVVVFDKYGENCANNLGKGRLVGVTGRLQFRKYEDQEGKKRVAAEIVASQVDYLDWPKDGERGAAQTQASDDLRDLDDDDLDSIPF